MSTPERLREIAKQLRGYGEDDVQVVSACAQKVRRASVEDEIAAAILRLAEIEELEPVAWSWDGYFDGHSSWEVSREKLDYFEIPLYRLPEPHK